MSELEAMVEDILRPLVRADGGDVELVHADGEAVVLRVSGTAAFGAGSEIVRQQVLRAGVRKVLGDVEVVFEKVVPRPRRRSEPPAGSADPAASEPPAGSAGPAASVEPD